MSLEGFDKGHFFSDSVFTRNRHFFKLFSLGRNIEKYYPVYTKRTIDFVDNEITLETGKIAEEIFYFFMFAVFKNKAGYFCFVLFVWIMDQK